MNTKRIFIIHRWSGGPRDDWRPWVRAELEKKGYEVVVPQMLDTNTPTIENWVGYLKEIVGTPDVNTFFIGHRIGCQAIMRYLATLSENVHVGGVVFVAGWFNLEGLKEEGEEIERIAKPWIETPIDFDRIRIVCPHVDVFISDNEPFGCVEENKKIFEEKLNAKVSVLKEKGHFTADDGVVELPEVVELF